MAHFEIIKIGEIFVESPKGYMTTYPILLEVVPVLFPGRTHIIFVYTYVSVHVYVDLDV